MGEAKFTGIHVDDVLYNRYASSDCPSWLSFIQATTPVYCSITKSVVVHPTPSPCKASHALLPFLDGSVPKQESKTFEIFQIL